MKIGDFVNNILLRYIAFLDRKVVVRDDVHGYMKEKYTTLYTYKYDTPWPNWPCYRSENHILYDYSFFLNADITLENADTILNDFTINQLDVLDFTAAECEEIMLNNMKAMQRFEKLCNKIEKMKSLKKQIGGWET